MSVTENGPDAEAVEVGMRAAIAEAASCVESAAEEAPSSLTGSDADAAASAANVGRAWTDVTVGMIAGLERFRLAHDKVAGTAQGVNPPKLPGDEPEPPPAEALLAKVLQEARNGASPVRIAQIIEQG